MSDNNLFKSIKTNDLLKRIFSPLQLNICFKLIKYNKSLQQVLNISIEDSIFNYQHKVLTKDEIIKNLKDFYEDNEYISELSFSAKFNIYYFYDFPMNLNDIGNENLFLIKYKGYKIDEYPLPSNFNSMNIKDKINILEENEYFYKYTINEEMIELIELINEFREKNGLNKLIYNEIENLNDYFNRKNSKNKNHLFINPFGEFKNNLLKNDKNITKRLLIKNLNCIMILEKGKKEYVFIYQDCNNKEKLEIETGFDIKDNSTKFHIINNTIPIVDVRNSTKYLQRRILNNLADSFKDEGYQILSFKNDTLIGVLEGPPATPLEDGYFLFKIIFPEGYSFRPPQFFFISKIFHPNISEDGYVYVDILQQMWSPAIANFNLIIYSIQSLLNDPNTDDFINEKAAKLCKEDRNIYDKTVREYTSIFANYSKFLDYIRKMNIKLNINKKENEFIFFSTEDKIYKKKELSKFNQNVKIYNKRLEKNNINCEGFLTSFIGIIGIIILIISIVLNK